MKFFSRALYQSFINFALLLIPISSNAADNAEYSYQHEINYGLNNLTSFSFIDMDWSEFPFLGVSYKYYFSPLDSKNINYPFAIQSDLNRTGWIQVDRNILIPGAHIAGNIYIADNWKFEFDVRSIKNKYTTTVINNNQVQQMTTIEKDLFTDVSVNYAVSNQWSVGLNFRQFSENNDYVEIIEDYLDETQQQDESDNVIAIQARYSNIENNRGWDIKYSTSNFGDHGSQKVFASYYYSKQNGTTFGIVHSSLFNSGVTDVNDSMLAISFKHQYWFSSATSIDYGFSSIKFDDHHRFGLFDINGTWRF